MLSKNNKILIGCLALLLAMSVGYALFSDTITINGSATAKGELSTSMTCGITDDNQTYVDNDMETMRGGVENATITCENSVVTSSVTLTRPDSSVWFYIEVENTGTIPYKLKSVENLDTGEVGDIDNSSAMMYSTNVEKKLSVEFIPAMLSWDGADENGFTETVYTPEGSWEDYLFENIVTPGKKQVFYINARWGSYENQPSVGEGVSVTGRFKLNFEQVTN